MLSGASSGIGEHLAGVIARAGGKVALGARRTERTHIVAENIVREGGEALALPLDVTDEASIIAAFDAAESKFGTIDTVIANAGTSAPGWATSIEADDVRSVLDTNLLGVYLLAREGARRMIAAGSREKGNCRILLVGSITAAMTGQGDSAYAASKAAVAHLGRQFAREWVRQGINVNTVQPGYIQTEIAGDWFQTDGGRQQIAGWHRKRLMDIGALDEVVLFLCSDAARYVTGATITVDDGQSL